MTAAAGSESAGINTAENTAENTAAGAETAA